MKYKEHEYTAISIFCVFSVYVLAYIEAVVVMFWLPLQTHNKWDPVYLNLDKIWL